MRSTVLALAALVVLPFAVSQAADTKGKPNVVVILADDVGWGDPGCYGATKVKTPNIDKIATGGVRFEDGHASAAVCTPTRYSLLTGQYSWRQKAEGLNKGVASGASPLLIPPATVTAPALLKKAGYRTAMVGKWHLGFCTEKPDYNEDLTPGPLDLGFDEFFGIPATNDRMPTVYVRDRRVVGLDPKDPIKYSFNEADAKAEGLGAWAAGRNRIGWAKGGKAAWWKDDEMADTLTKEAVKFIERNKESRFFLLFTPHNVHAPTVPNARFVGTSGLGNRGDALHELDASVGQILDTLDKLKLADDTLVVFSSDNGAYVTDEKGHKPNGPFRGKKSQLWEGGHRVPLIARWPGRIKAGVSTDLASTIDVPATVCAAAGVDLPKGALPDSFNLLPALTGVKDAGKRDHLVVMSGNGHLAIRSAGWKYIPDLTHADGWESGKEKKPDAPTGPGLYDLSRDAGETTNLVKEKDAEAKRLAEKLAWVRATAVTRP